jgi:urease accessory protein
MSMLHKFSQRFSPFSAVGLSPKLAIALPTVLAASLLALPAQAHHPMGGTTPTTALEGFLSGLGHPIVGPDHFAFVVALGLIASLSRRGFVLPAAFVLATLAGTGLHLAGLTIPGAEVGISLSVLLAGGVLAAHRKLGVKVLAGMGTLAGILHGYAYGESIIGAEMTPLVAYLAGFAVIQLGVSLGAFWLGRQGFQRAAGTALKLRFAGFAIAGAGAAFLSSTLLG